MIYDRGNTMIRRGFGATEAWANARIIEEVSVSGAGTFDLTIPITISSTATSVTAPVPSLPGVRTAGTLLEAVAYMTYCADASSCGLPDLSDTELITATGPLPDLTGSITAPAAGIIRIDVGFGALSFAHGEGSAATSAAGTLGTVTCTPSAGTCTV